MGERIKLSEFDILGVIDLNNLEDAIGIEKYLTPVKEDGKTIKYLSRSKEYYNVKNMTELAIERETLGHMLTNELTKRNFVIIENMLNCSGKVYFKKFEEYILSGRSQRALIELTRAEECLMEDVRNMLVIFENQGDIQIDFLKRLPAGDENAEKRAIEMDNKALLYIFSKCLKIKKDSSEIEVLTPGYGSLYIGPFLKGMYGYNFTNILKSKYIEESKNLSGSSMERLMSSNRPFDEGKTVLLLDDNIGTGQTMRELREGLEGEGVKDIIPGAVQYNWRNYYRVSIGEKTGIERPDISGFDIVIPFNFAGHKLYKHAIDNLHSSGIDYVRYLESKAYRKEECSDTQGSLIRTATALASIGIILPQELVRYIDQQKLSGVKAVLPNQEVVEDCIVSNPIATEMINRIVQAVEGIGITPKFGETNSDDGSR